MYTHQSKLYTEQKDAIEKLKNWVLKTTNMHLIRTACNPTDTIKQWYANLEEQVGVNDAKQRKDARERYKMAIKSLNKQPKDILAWLSAWEQAISLAKEKKVSEAQHSSEWFEDFAVVVKPWMDYWVTSYRMMKKKEIEAGNLSFRTLANDFREEVRSAPGNGVRRTIAKGAFGPSFAGEACDGEENQRAAGDALNQGDRETRVEGRGGRKPSGKRRYTGGSQSACPACGQFHALSECYYVFKDKAPSWFCFRSETEDVVKKALKENDQLRSEVEKLKGKKKKKKGEESESASKEE